MGSYVDLLLAKVLLFATTQMTRRKCRNCPFNTLSPTIRTHITTHPIISEWSEWLSSAWLKIDYATIYFDFSRTSTVSKITGSSTGQTISGLESNSMAATPSKTKLGRVKQTQLFNLMTVYSLSNRYFKLSNALIQSFVLFPFLCEIYTFGGIFLLSWGVAHGHVQCVQNAHKQTHNFAQGSK